MTSKSKLSISYEDVGDGNVLIAVTINAPSRFHSRNARLEQARRAWNAVVHEYGVEREADAFETDSTEVVRH